MDVFVYGDSSEKIGGGVLQRKEFRTGSRGYSFSGKILWDGKKYQLTVNMVEIGSKKEVKKDVE